MGRQPAIVAAWMLSLITSPSHGASNIQIRNSDVSNNDEKMSTSRKTLRGHRHLGLEDLAENRNRYVYDDISKDSDIHIIRFPFSRFRNGRGQGLGETVLNSPPSCQFMRLDFSKAADGRTLAGGSFVGDEWFQGYGVKVSAFSREGKKHDVHPMIFDSINVESNGLDRTDKYFLGSPNFECGGFGVGSGGRIGSDGENCQPLGNLLIPSRISGTPKKGGGANSGGVLVFDFFKKTEVEKIAVLNVIEDDGSEIEVVRNEGNSSTMELSSVGINGYQSISLGLENVERMYVSLESFAGVASIDLCVEDDSVNRN